MWAAEERIARLAVLPLPPAPIAPEPLTPAELDEVVVYFTFDRPRDGDAGVSRSDLAAATELATAADGAPLSLLGHASVEGPERYNQRLGQRRADFVAAHLRATVPGVVAHPTSAGESAAASVTTDEYVDEEWRKVVVSVETPGG